MLIYVMGEEAEKIFPQLTIREHAGEGPARNTLYKRTLDAFDTYFNPRNNALHYTILFHNRNQLKHESNEEYIRNVHVLSLKCGFPNVQRDDMLRTRLLAGMSDKVLSRELQLDAKVTLDTVRTKMRAKEIITKHQREEIDGTSSSSLPVNLVQRYRGKRGMHSGRSNCGPTGIKSLARGRGEDKGEKEGKERRQDKYQKMISNCKYCGRSHTPGRCPAYGKRCNQCKKFNHFAVVCSNKPFSKNSAACAIVDQSEITDDSDSFQIDSVNDSEWRTMCLSMTIVLL